MPSPTSTFTFILSHASEVLTSCTTSQAASTAKRPHLGGAVLAVLLAETEDQAAHDAVSVALPVWLPNMVQRIGQLSLYGGQAEALAGLRLITDIYPPTIRLVNKVKDWLAEAIHETPLQTEQVRFQNYDLFHGPSGMLLAGLVGTSPADIEEMLVHHLTSLADPKLTGFRITGFENDKLSGWMQGGINNGLAHGVPGVLAALALANDGSPKTLGAIRNIADWLVNEAFTDERGVISWSARGHESAPPPSGVVHRQAYCYGTPGVAWSLWLAGEALGSAEIRMLALEAMRSLCLVYDFETYVYGEETDQLGICHGAAGTLLIADAFANNANLAEAAELRDRVIVFLVSKIDQIVALNERDSSLLTGAPGMLAALLTATGGARTWLPCLALK